MSAALLASGLPTSSYTFLGFPPRKPGPRRRFFQEEAERPHTLIFHESPFRLGAALRDALSILGDRRVALAVELTKLHQKVERGWLSSLADEYSEKTIRGEVTVVIAGNKPKFLRLAGNPEEEPDSPISNR